MDGTHALWLVVAGALFGGALLGVAYFRLLRTTVERLPSVRRPGTLMLASLVGRTAMAIGAFYLAARYGHWPALAAALGGFLLARTWMLRGADPGAASHRERSR